MVRASPAAVSISRPEADEPEETPLDPAVERIRQRLKRLILVSSATLFVGLAAVLVAVLYKIGPVRDKPGLAWSEAPAAIPGAIPSGARVLSTALDGTMLAITLEDEAGVGVVLLDLETGSIVHRTRLDPAAPGG